MQCILSALMAIIIAFAPVFNIPLTVVPPKGELPHESEPAPSELSVYDKVVGVDDSVFYISRPNAENMKIIYASDFGMDSNSQDNTDAFCRAIDYCRRNPGTRLVIDAGEYRFSPKNTIGLNSLKNVLIDAEDVHIADTNGHFRVSGCDFSYMGDDSLNVHDNLLYIKQRVSDNALTVYANQYLLTIGDTMKFKLGTYSDIDFEAKITDISADGVISFDRTLPEEIAADTIMYIADCDSGNYVISNNYFHEQRARGLLLQSDNGLCENNRFYKIMGQQIKIVMDIMPGLWYEGTGVNNLVIRNNEFKLGCYSGWDSAIRIETNIAGNGAQVAAFSNITVDSNRFINCENYILRADNVSGLNITNNKIINTRSIDGIDLRCGRIRLGDCCSAVKISGNRWNKTPLAPFGDIIALDHGLKAFL